MRSKKRLSIKNILRQRQRGLHVERIEHTGVFAENLDLPADDERRRFVFAVSGQGGVGKTTLLRRFRDLVEGTGGISALVDETERDVPEAMARIAEQLRDSGRPLDSFEERYKTYRQRRDSRRVSRDNKNPT